MLDLHQEHIMGFQSCYSNSEHHRATDRTPTELGGPSRFDLQRSRAKITVPTISAATPAGNGPPPLERRVSSTPRNPPHIG